MQPLPAALSEPRARAWEDSSGPGAAPGAGWLPCTSFWGQKSQRCRSPRVPPLQAPAELSEPLLARRWAVRASQRSQPRSEVTVALGSRTFAPWPGEGLAVLEEADGPAPAPSEQLNCKAAGGCATGPAGLQGRGGTPGLSLSQAWRRRVFGEERAGPGWGMCPRSRPGPACADAAGTRGLRGQLGLGSGPTPHWAAVGCGGAGPV